MAKFPTRSSLFLALVMGVAASLLCFSDAFVPEHPTNNRLGIQQSTRPFNMALNASTQKYPCACPDDNENNDEEPTLEDRREAMFAMIGSVWASTTVLSASPESANAVYGTDAKMSFPDPLQGLSDRNSKQCLVESLGNRECLVYQEDEEKLLYKGADVQVLLGRVQVAAEALDKEIPKLVEKSKWNALTGVLTGPMGQLSATMTSLEKLAENPSVAKQNSQKVKQDIFAIGTAVTQKKGDVVLKYQQLALQDLAVFLKAL